LGISFYGLRPLAHVKDNQKRKAESGMSFGAIGKIIPSVLTAEWLIAPRVRTFQV
jgi:hypothetical protein